MCGLFGTTQHYGGTGSAGIATCIAAPSRPALATREQIAARWRILTDLGAFTDHLPSNPRLRSNVRGGCR